jgi:hypothetical protein
MPNIYFIVEEQGEKFNSDVNYFMAPYNYEMFPKVQQSTKTTSCDLGLWKLGNETYDVTNYDE